MKKRKHMNKRKSQFRYIIMCIALTLLCGVAGCGKKADVEQTENETKPTVTQETVKDSEQMQNPESTTASTPTEILTKFNDVKVGDTVTFGTYEQDDETANGAEDIEWYVIERKDDEVLLLSKCCLDTKPFQDNYDTVTWETCTLREWLNNEFYNKAFSSKEQSCIKLSSLTTEVKSNNEGSGITTKDKVFLLSLNDVKQYFSLTDTDNENMFYCYDSCFLTEMTTYAWLQGGERDGHWWLRSPGMNDSLDGCIALVQNVPNTGTSEPFGAVDLTGTFPFAEDHSVRPALWLDLNP